MTRIALTTQTAKGQEEPRRMVEKLPWQMEGGIPFFSEDDGVHTGELERLSAQGIVELRDGQYFLSGQADALRPGVLRSALDKVARGRSSPSRL